LVRCSLSALNLTLDEEGKLFSQLLDQLKFYARFEISDETGDPLDDIQMMQVSKLECQVRLG
jgi:intron-binding protein aquarius